MLALVLLLSANPLVPRDNGPNVAAEARWTWSDEKATRDYCAKKHLHDYKVEVKGREARIVDGEKTLFTFDAYAVFACSGEKLFLADYEPSSSGCRVTAIDL
jgi:hypothetical protein